MANRFTTKDILEAIITPDKAVSDQYASTIYTLKNGESVLGRQMNEDAGFYYIAQNPFDQKTIKKYPRRKSLLPKSHPFLLCFLGSLTV